MARTRLTAFLSRHGLTHADLDQDRQALTTWPGFDGDGRMPEPRPKHVVHRIEGLTSSGRKWQAWCRCGHGSTPRTTRDRALEALRTGHLTEPPVRCLCGKDYTDAGWMGIRDGLRVLVDTLNGDEFMCCEDIIHGKAQF